MRTAYRIFVLVVVLCWLGARWWDRWQGWRRRRSLGSDVTQRWLRDQLYTKDGDRRWK